MNCPYCNNPMLPGFIQARSEIYFTQKPHKLLFSAGKDETILTQKNKTSPTAVAYHCSVCRKVIVTVHGKPFTLVHSALWKKCCCKKSGRD